MSDRPAPRRGSLLLINEPALQVLPTLAAIAGLHEAIFIQQVHYWLGSSRHVFDGRYWIYNKVDDWHKQMPFMTKRTLERAIAHLKELGFLLITQEYNERPTDRTSWYTIDYDLLDAARQEYLDSDAAKMADSKPPKRRDGKRQNDALETANLADSIIRNQEITNNRDDATASRAASQADTPSPLGGGTSENPPTDTEGGEKKGGPAKNKGANATLTEHPLNQAFHSLHANWPSHLQMKMIMESAPPLDNWIRAMREWSGRGYRYNNIKAQLEWAHNPALMERERPAATSSSKKSIYAKPEEVVVEDPNDVAEMKRWFEEAYPEKEE